MPRRKKVLFLRLERVVSSFAFSSPTVVSLAERAGGPVNLQQNKVTHEGNSGSLETDWFNPIHPDCERLVDSVQAPHRPLLYS